MIRSVIGVISEYLYLERARNQFRCADLDGKADVRYRRYSFKTTADNPWLETS